MIQKYDINFCREYTQIKKWWKEGYTIDNKYSYFNPINILWNTHNKHPIAHHQGKL